jgi:hypothetical protein
VKIWIDADAAPRDVKELVLVPAVLLACGDDLGPVSLRPSS